MLVRAQICFLRNILLVFRISNILLSIHFPISSAISPKELQEPAGAGEKYDHSTDAHKNDHVHAARAYQIPHYGENPDTTKKLIELEDKLATNLSDLHKSNTPNVGDQCHKYLSKYLNDYNDDTFTIGLDRQRRKLSGSISRAEYVVEDPILTLKVLRRIVNNLLRDALRECAKSKNKVVEEIVTQLFEKDGLVQPHRIELKKAYAALMTNTFLYGINVTNDIRLNKFGETSAQLKFEDYMAIANITLGYDEKGVLSYHWLRAATNVLVTESPDEDKQKMLEHGWKRLMNNAKLTSMAQLRTLGETWQSTWHLTHYEHDGICRGIVENSPSNESDGLVCTIKNVDMLILKIEIISVTPLVILYHDFLNEKEINFIRHESPARLVKTSMVAPKETFEFEREYNGELTHLLLEMAKEKNRRPVVQRLTRKVELTTRLKVTKNEESIYHLALHTPLGQHLNVEQLRGTFNTYDPIQDSKPYGSFLMFLTNVRMGGFVIFPEINSFVKPERGSALFFLNYKQQYRLSVNKKLYHQTCPVVLGMTEVAHLPLSLPEKE